MAWLVSILPEGTPRTEQIRLDVTVAALAILIAGASGLLFGVIPALQASRTRASIVLRSGDRGSTGDRRRIRTRAALVIGEVALTLVLLVSAVLLANSFLRLQRVDPGFESDGVALVTLPLPQSRYRDGRLQAAFDRPGGRRAAAPGDCFGRYRFSQSSPGTQCQRRLFGRGGTCPAAGRRSSASLDWIREPGLRPHDGDSNHPRP